MHLQEDARRTLSSDIFPAEDDSTEGNSHFPFEAVSHGHYSMPHHHGTDVPSEGQRRRPALSRIKSSRVLSLAEDRGASGIGVEILTLDDDDDDDISTSMCTGEEAEGGSGALGSCGWDKGAPEEVHEARRDAALNALNVKYASGKLRGGPERRELLRHLVHPSLWAEEDCDEASTEVPLPPLSGFEDDLLLDAVLGSGQGRGRHLQQIISVGVQSPSKLQGLMSAAGHIIFFISIWLKNSHLLACTILSTFSEFLLSMLLFFLPPSACKLHGPPRFVWSESLCQWDTDGRFIMDTSSSFRINQASLISVTWRNRPVARWTKLILLHHSLIIAYPLSFLISQLRCPVQALL